MIWLNWSWYNYNYVCSYPGVVATRDGWHEVIVCCIYIYNWLYFWFGVHVLFSEEEEMFIFTHWTYLLYPILIPSNHVFWVLIIYYVLWAVSIRLGLCGCAYLLWHSYTSRLYLVFCISANILGNVYWSSPLFLMWQLIFTSVTLILIIFNSRYITSGYF